jgi:hypothetical protein
VRDRCADDLCLGYSLYRKAIHDPEHEFLGIGTEFEDGSENDAEKASIPETALTEFDADPDRTHIRWEDVDIDIEDL